MQLACDAGALQLAHFGHRDGELSQLPVRAPDLMLGGRALRDVAQDHREQLLPAHCCMRDRGLDLELAAVRTQSPQRRLHPHAPRCLAGVAEALDVGPVRAAEPFRDEALERLADGIGCPATEHLLCRGVEQHDALIAVDGDDRVHCRAHDRLQAHLCLVHVVLRGLQTGHVRDSADDAGGLGLGIVLRHCR